MRELGNSGAWPRKRWRVVSIAAALLGAAVLCQPDLAHAAHGGGGGFHGGGFHGGGFHRGVAGGHHAYGYGHRGRWYHGWHGGRYGWWAIGPGLAWAYYDYPWWGSYPGYDYYGYSQPYASQTWYYCSDPAGYYPYVTQCNTGWLPVPAS
jgi:hypothetical protein